MARVLGMGPEVWGKEWPEFLEWAQRTFPVCNTWLKGFSAFNNQPRWPLYRWQSAFFPATQCLFNRFTKGTKWQRQGILAWLHSVDSPLSRQPAHQQQRSPCKSTAGESSPSLEAGQLYWTLWCLIGGSNLSKKSGEDTLGLDLLCSPNVFMLLCYPTWHCCWSGHFLLKSKPVGCLSLAKQLFLKILFCKMPYIICSEPVTTALTQGSENLCAKRGDGTCEFYT